MIHIENRKYIDLSPGSSLIGIRPVNHDTLANMVIKCSPYTDKNEVSELAHLYVKWGRLFNIQSDFAWAQMCIETGFLNRRNIKTKQNNFGGLTTKDQEGRRKFVSLDSTELGVIAHFAHLAWYASIEHVNEFCSQEYDPNHNEINGNVHLNAGYRLNCLDGKWNQSMEYSKKISLYTNIIYNLLAEGRNSSKKINPIKFLRNKIIDSVNLPISSRNWEYISIHHSATHNGSVDAFRRFHVENKGWRDIGYQFVICNGDGGEDGEIQTGRSIDMRGAHSGGEYNGKAIGVCLVGWFDNIIYDHADSKKKKFENNGNKIPTQRQIESLNNLVFDLAQEYNIPPERIIGHREVPEFIGKKSCPGYNFNIDEFRE